MERAKRRSLESERRRKTREGINVRREWERERDEQRRKMGRQ